VLGKYSRDEKLLPLAEAVHKMTGLPAARFGLTGRGLIRQGYLADLVLFDPETIRDTATFDNPVCAAEGVERVWVNGVLSYRSGAPTGQRSGRFIKRSAARLQMAKFDSRQFEEHG
jgi:N-acyl-D-amino-acid deacylase